MINEMLAVDNIGIRSLSRVYTSLVSLSFSQLFSSPYSTEHNTPHSRFTRSSSFRTTGYQKGTIPKKAKPCNEIAINRAHI